MSNSTQKLVAAATSAIPTYVLAVPLPRVPRPGTVYDYVVCALRGLDAPSTIPEIVDAVRETDFAAKNDSGLWRRDPGKYLRLYVETTIKKEYLQTPEEAAEAAEEAAEAAAKLTAAAAKKAAAAEKRAAKKTAAAEKRAATKAAKAAKEAVPAVAKEDASEAANAS